MEVLPGLPESDDEILRLDVSVDDVLLVEDLHAGDHLVTEHKYRFYLTMLRRNSY